MLKKIINLAFILMISFVVCSCSAKSEAEPERGRKVEQNEQKVGNETTSEASWIKKTLQKPEGAEFVNSLNYLADGTIRINTVDQDFQNSVIWDTRNNGDSWDNADADMSLTVENGYGYHYSAEGSLYTYNNRKLILSAGEGTEVKTININEDESISGAAISGNMLAVLVDNMNSMQSRVDIYDLKTMECRQLNNPQLSEFLTSLFEIGGSIAVDSSGEMIYLAGIEIAQYDLKRDNFDYLLDQESLNGLVNQGEESITSFAVDSTGNKIVLCVMDLAANRSKLYMCEKGIKKELGKASEDKLRIYSLKESGIRQAVSLFQEKCPELEVTFEVGYTGKDGVTLSDAIRTLNTELMAGEGPDILLLDGLPADSYVKSGILEDVTGIVEPRKDQFFYNIISAYNGGDNVYKVPMTFNIPVILGDTEVVGANNNAELMEVLERKAGNGIPLISPENLSSIAGSLFITSDIQQGTLDEEKLADFYYDLKMISDKSISDEKRQSIDEWHRLTYWADQYPTMNSLPELDIYFERAQFGIDSLSLFENYMQILTVCKEKGLSYQYINREKGNHFIASNVLGINSTGKHKDAAKLFLEYYLSGEAQKAGVYGGFSIIRSNMEGTRYVSEGGEWMTSTSNKDTPEEVLNMYAITTAELQELIAFFEKADTPVKDNAVVIQKVMEQADACLFEGKDPESVAKEVCREINLYLSE